MSISSLQGKTAGLLPNAYEFVESTTVNTAAAQNTYGSYVELFASTTSKTLRMILGYRNSTISRVTRIRLATGAAGSEEAFCEVESRNASAGEIKPIEIDFEIPAGRRVAASTMNTVTNDADVIILTATLLQRT